MYAIDTDRHTIIFRLRAGVLTSRVYLSQRRGFWGRLLVALFYVIGEEPDCWEETVLEDKDRQRLMEMLECGGRKVNGG